MAMASPYTYLIGWTTQDKWYYGVRYSKDCSPSDLWNTYFTSSKLVAEMRLMYGEPDVVTIRKNFSEPKEALAWEQKVLRRLNVLRKDKWLNCGVGGTWYIQKQTQEHITRRTQNKKHNPLQRELAIKALQKAAETNTGKQQSEETQDKKRETYRRNWDKNQVSAQRQSWVTYRIEGKTYVGNKAVMEAFGITEPTIYNRVNNPKFNWERLNG